MLTLLLGRDWTANSDEILRRIAHDVNSEQGGRILLVPELVSHDTERRLAAAAGDTASRFAQVLSFSRLARRVSESVGSAARESLDNGGRVVAMAAAARSLHSKLKVYAAVETKPEFLAELVDAMDECKRCCISAADLMEASRQSEGSLAQKLEELSLLLESYDALCARGKRDPRDQMNWVLEQLEDMDLAKNTVLYVDGFPDFTRQHLAVLEHFILNSPEVVVSLNCDQIDSLDPAFEKAGATAKEIYQIAHRAGIEVQVRYVAEREDGLRPVRRALFRGAVAQTPDTEMRVRTVHTGSAYQQCQAAAEEIMALTAAGVRYRDISIVCTDMAAFGPTLRLVMRNCGIPIYQSGTEDVAQSGVMRTVLLALEAALGGFAQRDVLRYLRSVLSPLSQEDCDKVENYAVIWGISGSKWLQNWTGHPDGLNGRFDENTEAALLELNRLRSFAMAPLQRLREAFREAKQLSQQVQALYAYLEEVEFAQRLDAFAQAMDADGDSRSAQILNQLWEILLGALEQLHDVLADTVWEDAAFIRLLKLLLSQYDVGTIPAVLDAVTVGPVTAMRCQREEYLIILGAEEGALPGYGGSKGLLTDQERVQLRGLGVPLTGGSMEGLQAEFAEIYGVFCGAQKAISLYSASSQPSFIFHRLSGFCGGERYVTPQLANALRSKEAAAAYLAKFEDHAAATQLGVVDLYLDALRRRDYTLGSIGMENVQKLYGKTLNLSASQIDRQAECRLSYFLKYGLRAQERKEATVDPAEFGTYVHAVLEKTARDVMARGGFHYVDLETTMAIARKHSQEYAEERFSLLDSQRLEYLFRRNMLELEMVVQELWLELNQAEYVPHAFEMQFGLDGEMPAIEITGAALKARLRGLVDRVDVWKTGESTFFRVVDYKTGKKDFDYCDVFNGVGLQMLLYLFALEDAGSSIGSKRVSAGVQYFPARAPYVSVDGAVSEEEAAKERKKLWERKGLLLENTDSLQAMDPTDGFDRLCCKRKKDGTVSGDLADSVQLGQLKDYVMQVLRKLIDEIASGDVTANPYTRGYSHDACTFCPYGAICHKETVTGRRNYKKMESQEFWEAIGKEAPNG